MVDTHPERWLWGTTLQSLFLDSEEETLHNFWPVFTGERYKFRHGWEREESASHCAHWICRHQRFCIFQKINCIIAIFLQKHWLRCSNWWIQNLVATVRLTSTLSSFCVNSGPGTPVTFIIWVNWSMSNSKDVRVKDKTCRSSGCFYTKTGWFAWRSFKEIYASEIKIPNV